VSIAQALEKKGMQVYVPPQSLKDTFKAKSQKPILAWLKKKIDPKLVDQAIKAVGDIEKQVAKETK